MAGSFTNNAENDVLARYFDQTGTLYDLTVGLRLCLVATDPETNANGELNDGETDSNLSGDLCANIDGRVNNITAKEIITFDAPSGGQIQNDAEVIFDVTGSVTISGFYLETADANADIIAYGALSSPITAANGDTVSFPADSITITMA